MTAKQVANHLTNDLKSLKPYYYCKAQSGSIYIKFADDRLRSIRIADHPGIKKYHYKWNLIKGWQESNQQPQSKYTRFFYSWDDYQSMVEHILNYACKIKAGDNREEPI